VCGTPRARLRQGFLETPVTARSRSGAVRAGGRLLHTRPGNLNVPAGGKSRSLPAARLNITPRLNAMRLPAHCAAAARPIERYVWRPRPARAQSARRKVPRGNPMIPPAHVRAAGVPMPRYLPGIAPALPLRRSRHRAAKGKTRHAIVACQALFEG
jgi:hypothetical protein